jgi:oligopeptide transport system permease protein
MLNFIIRRFIQMIIVLLGATFILFACLFVLPGDPVSSIAGSDRARDPAVIAELRNRYNLDKPLPVQYGAFVWRLVHGDLGEDYTQRRSVNEILGPKVVNSAKLAGVAILIDVALGIFAGIIAAVLRYSFWDVLITLLTTIAIGFPVFVIGLLLQQTFALQLDILPLFGMNAGFSSYILPATTIALIDAALVARLMRGTLLEVLRADYVRTATAKGLPRRTVLGRHAMRNAVIPVLTYLGISFGGFLSGALITEAIYNWDGIGLALVVAIQQQNNPIIVGIVAYSVVIFVVVNLIVDLAYAALDPRIRLA